MKALKAMLVMIMLVCFTVYIKDSKLSPVPVKVVEKNDFEIIEVPKKNNVLGVRRYLKTHIENDEMVVEDKTDEIVVLKNEPVVKPVQTISAIGCLTRSGGVFYGISGKETWYNLEMGGCIQSMRTLGYSEEDYPYWIRDDGCKMLGDYIMVAANLQLRPKGTILETSLGMGIVVDTGGFATFDSLQIDVATNW